ncbi:SpoIIE family protein phosphatase [bacterium]|nr:SpoIIE family protein phosphatase [bacterium]
MTTTPEQTDQETQRQLNGLSRLADVTRQLASLTDIDQILSCVTSGACEAICCERASLYLYDSSESVLYTRIVTELEIAEIRSPIDTGVTGWVARHKEISNVESPQLDARWNSDVDRETGFHTRNILAAPVISSTNQELLGVLQILNRENGTFDNFDEQLIAAFAAHAANALERSSLLLELRRANELEIAVDLARRIQTGFLPTSLPATDGYEVAEWWEPAESVSGDYYDVLQLPDGRIAFVVADVTGHGVGPSLIMASTRAMLHVLTRTISDPIQIVSRLQQAIDKDLRDGRFVTLFLAALDVTDHEIEYVNAGHGPVLHVSNNDCTVLEATGLPVGVSLDIPISSGECDLKPGDLLLLSTDGAIETRDDGNQMFGTPRLIELIQQHQHSSAPEIIEVTRQAIREFRGQPHPADDITMLLLKRGTDSVATEPL